MTRFIFSRTRLATAILMGSTSLMLAACSSTTSDGEADEQAAVAHEQRERAAEEAKRKSEPPMLAKNMMAQERMVMDAAAPMPKAKMKPQIAVGAAQLSAGHAAIHPPMPSPHPVLPPNGEPENNEVYDRIVENSFKTVLTDPLSTFSIDVDTASYTNVRRMLNDGQLPPADAVRIEEMINYFTYDYPRPTGEHPFSVYSEIAPAPWNADHQLVHIGLSGKAIPTADLPSSNLVFLLDVSGSMNYGNKLPLLKRAFRLLVEQLDEKDRVSIVVYAGAAGVVLEPTPGNENTSIIRALDKLSAGGSTAGGQGIELAYQMAEKHFIKGGNNRVILATDGDFNVGPSSDAELTRIIEQKREKGVFLTVLGFGSGNYRDNKMEKLANQGNGNFAYIDNIREARKVLVEEMAGTLLTIAKDVKLQLEFNPAKVKSYRLIGYENRMLANEDFTDDKKDAGELGAGLRVTALYEIVPADGSQNEQPLKYQTSELTDKANSNDTLTVKLRYKQPDSDTSQPFQYVVDQPWKTLDASSDDFRFAASVAEFGLLLRDSQYKGNASFDQVLTLGKQAKGKDDEGYRAEFLHLVESAQLLGSSEPVDK
ncbi:MAG: VWA domain-containing protein [Oceanobacter sp.]